MRQLRHALTGAIYELTADGNVQVSKDGKTGLFDPEARWLGGEIKAVDPELCRWVGYGPKQRGDIRDNRRFRAALLPKGDAETDSLRTGQL